VRRTSFADMACSLARTLEVIGGRWTLLVLRDLFLGLSRFDDIRANLGIATNVLTDRLATLLEHGLVERRAYQQRPPRFEYLLTDKGRDLFPAIAALMRWGDRWQAGDAGPPLVFRHDHCGQITEAVVVCACCAEPLQAGNVTPLPGPGGRLGRGTDRVGAVVLERTPATSPEQFPGDDHHDQPST
jgi:DNA-binding HxlR family transcriptional regulator